MFLAYTNARIFTGYSTETNKAVLVNNNQIVDILPASEIPSHYQQKDLGGYNLAPAFIDLQIYGGNGRLFSQEITLAALHATYEYCLAGGCTHFMITMATNTIEKFLKGMDVVRNYWEQGGKGLLGLHLEGPYMNPVKRGRTCWTALKTYPARGFIITGAG
ncbi:hypothetical protein [Paraflavitalea speifideaquila]|uniref:hypothetical protein n=1 Tax=Paraflavitalea speifideaquila TaxID=3076558 RepID=UPI0028E738A4|nr:hypothetical protein [Paraflavitalea speifideiaquila]